MLESRVENKLKKSVEAKGGKCLKFVSPGMRGVPDRICLFPGGKIIFVETKAPAGKPEPLQKKRHDELRALGFDVRVVNTLEEAKEVVPNEVHST
ncbi:VRR-NUC domain-containing protein [Ruminiclostridium cellobioparum]|uniref:VRR-NUC domain-containing protein n=1 Tax=Ruminiclostridium cellobioparum TaxID=29355 RepID=UPI0004819248|nr:VRR-NUC domain-containing protein [Ruminiclostridium cellobioparum]